MELTPRVDTAPPPDPPTRSSRRWLAWGVVGVLVLVVGVLVYKGLSDAALYFRTADEAVAQRDELGDRRFRMEGTVVAEPVEAGNGIEFDVTHADVTVAVHHEGAAPEMFAPGIPVVIEGSWDPSGEFFASDHILVRHDESYESQEDYDQRMSEANEANEANDTGSSGG